MNENISEQECEENDIFRNSLFDLEIEKIFFNNEIEDFNEKNKYLINEDKNIDKGSEKIFDIKKIKSDKNKFDKNKNKVFISKKVKKINDKNKIESKYFPFEKPRGILSSSKDNSSFPFKFITKKYFFTENGKRKPVKKKRKFKCDNINKKIKSRFHKTLKNIINKNLKNVGSKQLFSFLPQNFIEKTSRKENSEYLNLTYKELLSKDFSSRFDKNNNDYNCEHNKKVLQYLEENKEISEKSGFDIIQNIKYKELLKRYFDSYQFEDSILKLINEKESPEYINEYIDKAKNYIIYFSDNVNDNLITNNNLKDK
jgi:hypothetical protein